MGTYRPGKAGELRLEFEKRKGRTLLVRSYSKLPLQILRPYPFREPDQVYLPLINPTGGVVGGDTFDIRITLKKGARVYLTTPSATKIYRMKEGEESVQQMVFEVEEGSELAYHPEKTIPFAGSSFRQILRVNLDATGRFSMAETLAPGRVSRGEKFLFRRYYSRTEVRVENALVFLDVLDLQPEEDNLLEPGCLEGFEYLYTAFFHNWRDLQGPKGFQSLLATYAQEESRTAPAQPWIGSATTTHYGDVLIKALSRSPILLDDLSAHIRAIARLG